MIWKINMVVLVLPKFKIEIAYNSLPKSMAALPYDVSISESKTFGSSKFFSF